MSKTLFLSLFLSLFLFQSVVTAQGHKDIEKSISIEYAYIDVDTNDKVGQMMFAKKRFSVYADADYFMVQSYAKDPEPNTMDALIVGVIKELKTGKVYSCITIGERKLRLNETSDSRLVTEIFGGLSEEAGALTKIEDNTSVIASYLCEKWQLNSMDADSSVFYLYPNINAPEAIANLPLFVQSPGIPLRLNLGKDITFGSMTYNFRAQKIEIDQLQPIAAQLATFKDSNEAKVNKAIKEYLGF